MRLVFSGDRRLPNCADKPSRNWLVEHGGKFAARYRIRLTQLLQFCAQMSVYQQGFFEHFSLCFGQLTIEKGAKLFAVSRQFNTPAISVPAWSCVGISGDMSRIIALLSPPFFTLQRYDPHNH